MCDLRKVSEVVRWIPIPYLAQGPGDASGIGKMFSDPNLITKLATNPRTQKHLADPTFMQRVKYILTNSVD